MESQVAPPVISAAGLTKKYGAIEVLRDASLEVARGEIVCVIGRSGSGKSTLLRCLNVLVEPTEGELALDGVSLAKWPRRHGPLRARKARQEFCQHRRRIGMVFQHFELFPHLTALQNVAVGPRFALGVKRQDALKHGRELLAQVGLADFENVKPARLSGGQKQRVAIARALAMRPDVLLLDEPTSALDPEMVSGVLDLLVQLAQDGMTMVVVTHELGFAVKVASRIVVVDAGQLVEQSTPADLVRAPKTEAARSLIGSLTAYHLTPAQVGEPGDS